MNERSPNNVTGDPRPIAVCLPGFGDNASMFTQLLETDTAARIRFVPFDLPGFGAPALPDTTLATLADAVLRHCSSLGARILIAHSVASIIASIAAKTSKENPHHHIDQIISLEGNLTAEDAYFSGTAANFSDALSFRAAFLDRLDAMASNDPIIAGYRDRVREADPYALWSLGCDAKAFSTESVPGALLLAAADVVYVHNPANCAAASLAWLKSSGLESIVIDGASHWPTIDKPEQVAKAIELAAR